MLQCSKCMTGMQALWLVRERAFDDFSCKAGGPLLPRRFEMHTTTNVEISPVSALVATVGDWLDGWLESARLAREAERLYGLSGTELARLGLRRDQIFAHVYGGAN
jgi:hypothetical protein